MTYVAPSSLKKNSIPATTTEDIAADAVAIPISDVSICYDKDGNLITRGYVLRNPTNLITPSPEEITITGCSVAYGVGGPGNITGVTRAVNYDVNTGGSAQGAAYAWPSGTVVAVMISTGVYNTLRDAIIAVWGAFSAGAIWGTTTPVVTSAVARYSRSGNTVRFVVSITISDGNGATSLTLALPVACAQVAGYRLPLTALKIITLDGDSIMSDPFAYLDYTDATPKIKFNQFGTLPVGYSVVIDVSGSYEVSA